VPPFNDDTVEKIFDNILNQRMEWPDIGRCWYNQCLGYSEDSIPPEAADLIKRLLTFEYKERIGHQDI
jgi:hypothetical protein